MDAPARARQEEGHTGFLHLPSEALALIFIAIRIQPSLSLSSTVKSNFVYPRMNRSPLVGHGFLFYFIFCEEISQILNPGSKTAGQEDSLLCCSCARVIFLSFEVLLCGVVV